MDGYSLEPEKTELQTLGSLLNDVVMNPDANNDARLRMINGAVYDRARKEAGVTASDLADENQENSPRVRHYWTLTSLLLGQVYAEAANQLAVYDGWNR